MTTETANALRAAKARIAPLTDVSLICEELGFGIVALEFAMLTALVRALPDGQRYLSRFLRAPTTTHADIMALFDRAIAAEEETP